MIRKKDGSIQSFDGTKIINAIEKSAKRVCVTLTNEEKNSVVNIVRNRIDSIGEDVSVNDVHNIVECALDEIAPVVAKAYREYRNYKKDFSVIIDNVYNKKLSLNSISDRSNANADSSLITTQKSIVYNELNSMLYDKFFLNDEEREIVRDGYLYIHDKGSRLDTTNCCLLDVPTILHGGFLMGNLEYTEPKSLRVAFDVICDIILNAGSSQYGGLTVSQFDKLIAPYAEKSYQQYINEYKNIIAELQNVAYDEKKADEYAYGKVKKDMAAGVQSIECRLNSLGSARGDYVFTAITFGLGTGRWETLFSSVCMKVRKEGQGREGFKHPVLFPKLSFFYDEELHGEGKPLEWLFDEAIDCSSKSMYPDFISLTGDGYAPSIYKKYRVPISRMGALAGCEHLYVSIDGKDPIDISIKDLFDYFDKNKEINARMCRVYFNKARQFNKDYSRYKIKYDKGVFEEKPGVYAITYIPEDVTYIEGSENIARRFVEHRHHITKYGCIDGGVNFNCYDCSKFKFEVLEYSENYKELESEYIKKIPNVNFKGFSNKFYKTKTAYKDVVERPYIPENKNREQRIIDLSLLDVKVLDKDNNWTKVNTIFKNDKLNSPAMMHIYYSENNKIYCLSCTEDHPLWNGSSFIRADKLKIGDCIYRADGLCLPITKVTYHWSYCESYDISTATGTFIGSDIIMHNCRAHLSPWFKRGGKTPADENDIPVYEGRINLGAISLHFPMIAAKAIEEKKDFWELLTYYLDVARGIHKKTFKYLSHKKAGINPLGFCQGGFLNGHKKPEEEIGEELLRPMTMSFGIIALNEASILMTGKPISEDNKFSIDILKFVNEYIAKYKEIDNILYAIYGVPGETLCTTQVKQFRKKYGIVKGVSDHEYTTNSFHCCVRDDITPIAKQDIEYPMFHLCTGGNIQYCRYPLQYNFDAIKTLVKRAMEMGFYEGVNISLDFCATCGCAFHDADKCPKCGSDDLVRIERMNGYLGYAKIRGKSFYADGKLKEFEERVSM